MFLEHTVDRVAQLVEKSSASIGILVRKNDDVARIMALLRERHIAGSQDGGNPLTDSAAVELILSLVHLADHPGDTISLFHVLNSPLATAFPFSKEDSQQEIGRWFAQLVASIGLGQAIEWVSERLAEHLSWWDQQRVEQLILRAHEHGKTGGRLRDFEQFVESHRVALPSDAQVKVMTIHKSKGLEFDAVFLPSLDISLTESPPKLIARRPSPCEPPNGILRYVKEKLQGILPADWQQAFHEDKSTGVYESLCILYVAMTRAKRALYMTTCPAGKDPGRGLGSLLQSTLANGLEISKDANALLYSVGDPEWYADLPKSVGLAIGRAAKDQEESSGNYQAISIRLSREKSKAPQSGLTLRAPSKAARGTGLLANLDKVAKSEDYGSSKVHLEVQTEFLRDALMESLATNHKASTAFGKLIHIWMAQIEWLDDFAMDHERLKQVAEAHLQSDELRYVSLPEAVSYFEKCLVQPSIRKCLSRANYSNKLGSQMSGRVVDEIDVENERPIRAVIEGQLVVGAIDRLIVLLANGTPVAAEVIDYKTDSPEDQPPLLWLNESLARHRPQLELYGRVVSELYGIDEGLVGKYLALLPTGDVISV